MYTRYELFCDGERQDIGLLMGIDELELNDEEKEILLDDFNDNLSVPEFYRQVRPDRKVLAFFTEEGVKFFEESIKKVIKAFEHQGLFQVAKAVVPEGHQSVVFKDDYQVLIREPKDTEFLFI